MKIFDVKDMHKGWFVGDFTPTAFKTNMFEVGTTLHRSGSAWDVHTHKIATEITYLVSGKMKLQNRVLEAGAIFILEPFEIADPEFLEDCFVVVIKTPSVPGDKYPLTYDTKS